MTIRRTSVVSGPAEKFARWVKAQGPNLRSADEAVADRLDCSVHMVRAMRRGQRLPGLDLAFRIEEASGYRIKARQWRTAEAA